MFHAAAQASRRVHFCFRRASAVSIAPTDRSRSWGLDCFSHHADYVFFCEEPLLALAFANRQTGAEMIAL
jgi:hypothetical protein